jgi:hypothetical protein
MTTYRFTNRFTKEVKDITAFNFVVAGLNLNPHEWVNTHVLNVNGEWVELHYNSKGMLCAN